MQIPYKIFHYGRLVTPVMEMDTVGDVPIESGGQSIHKSLKVIFFHYLKGKGSYILRLDVLECPTTRFKLLMYEQVAICK